jgi:hypothetical protein
MSSKARHLYRRRQQSSCLESLLEVRTCSLLLLPILYPFPPAMLLYHYLTSTSSLLPPHFLLPDVFFHPATSASLLSFVCASHSSSNPQIHHHHALPPKNVLARARRLSWRLGPRRLPLPAFSLRLRSAERYAFIPQLFCLHSDLPPRPAGLPYICVLTEPLHGLDRIRP